MKYVLSLFLLIHVFLFFLGMAAKVINGLTIHTAFTMSFGNKYKPLSDDERDRLRNILGHLRILIIDEFSMVGSDMLYMIHRRLQEIMQSQELFGGVSVLLFGDMMQLRPVNASWIFD